MFTDENFEVSNKTTSIFNEGLFQIQRIAVLKQSINEYRTKGDFKKWNWYLDSYWLEIESKVIKRNNKIKLVEDASNYDAVKSNSPAFKVYLQKCKTVNDAMRQPGMTGRQKQFLGLWDKESFIKTVQENLGMGGVDKYSEEAHLW